MSRQPHPSGKSHTSVLNRWGLAYLVGVSSGGIVFPVVSFLQIAHAQMQADKTGGDSGSPAAMYMALLLAAVAGATGGLFLVAIANVGAWVAWRLWWFRYQRTGKR